MEFKFSSSLVASGMEIIFFLLNIVFCIQAAILAYHWFTYGKNKEAAWSALTTYLVGGAILLFTMAGAIYFI